MRRAAARRRRFVTTDYVLDETATLLQARGHLAVVPRFFESVLGSEACRIQWMDVERFARTRDMFIQRLGQGWSFTDCLSFLLMKEMRLREALTKDAHFLAAGFSPLLA
jgi:predicted nucleic acid-binding protein